MKSPTTTLLNNKQEQFKIELMTQSSTDLVRKPQVEGFSGLMSSMSVHPSSPIISSEKESRMTKVNYPIHQPGTQGRKIFGFEIFVDNDVLNELQPQGEWFEKVKKAGEVESISFNLGLNIPELNGRNIQIYDKEMQKKYQSCRVLLADISKVFKQIKREQFCIIIFVPEGMISLLIGTKGYQINKIMRQSQTTIVVNQPINKMTYRTVKIQGYHSDIAKACRIIYQILEDKSSIAYSIQKQPSQLDYSKARVKTKFILCSNLLNYLLNKKKSIIKKIQEQTKCIIKFKEDTSNRWFKQDQELCVLLGKLEDVQAFIVMLINIIQLYHDDDRKIHDYTFKMLIPSNYVTKLIGQKGYMIRDITQRSGGAKIKILSDRNSEKDAKQCIISIDGTRQNKIDATCLILEQIQCFKNGGPILQSGKSINQNLAQQFKNSLPLHKGDEFFNQGITPLQEMCEKNKDGDNHEQQGQISVEEGEELGLSSLHSKSANENNQTHNKSHAQAHANNSKQYMEPEVEIRTKEHNTRARLDGRKISRSGSGRSDMSDSSASRSRKKMKRNIELKSSSSSSYKQDKQYVELKMVVPRKLAEDHQQLKYLQSLSHSEISIKDQKIYGSGESIICIKGSLKDNSLCIKLIQKRILRLAVHSSTR